MISDGRMTNAVSKEYYYTISKIKLVTKSGHGIVVLFFQITWKERILELSTLEFWNLSKTNQDISNLEMPNFIWITVKIISIQEILQKERYRHMKIVLLCW